MYPAVIARAVTAVAGTSRWPAFLASLNRYTRAAATSLDDVIKWVKTNPLSAGTIALILEDVGMGVAEFIGKSGEKPTREELETVKTVNKLMSPETIKALNEILSADGDKGSQVGDAKAVEMEEVKRAAVAFIADLVGGGNDRLSAFHTAIQLFTSMTPGDVMRVVSDPNNRVVVDRKSISLLAQ